MWIRWLRRRRLLHEPFPPDWLPLLERQHFYALLDDTERQGLRRIARVLVEEKYWEGCRGLVVTDTMRMTIAAQAARLILHMSHDYYPNVSSVLLYPTAFVVPSEPRPAGRPAGKGNPLDGQAVPRGPVVLAWDAVEPSITMAEPPRNVVLHEFAHKLDQQDGYSDGTPPLLGRASSRRWAKVLQEGYDRLVEQDRRGADTVISSYGATNRGEYFAVATECFFDRPAALRSDDPAVYELLRDYYRQDPAGRVAGRREGEPPPRATA